ncbi:MAG TPA: prephenate dehydratase [Dehalococcoidia bacterium]|jgi:prephenate dehydratase
MSEKIGYLGPPGTFGEQAALRYEPNADLIAVASNAAVVRAVAAGEVDAGIAPIENSLDGGINETLDALLEAEGLHIKAEVVLPVEHCLSAAKGTRLSDIEVVMSHPSALAQCKAFLESTLPRARLEAALSTAGAVARAVATPRAAAIGTRRAAELAGGEVLAGGIQDAKHNKTRFVVLASADAARTGDDKTSIALTVAHDRPGTLLGVLREFADRQINLTRIESRPSREELGIYVFLLDLQGHHSDTTVADALDAVRKQAHFFRLFGSYPRFQDGAL